MTISYPCPICQREITIGEPASTNLGSISENTRLQGEVIRLTAELNKYKDIFERQSPVAWLYKGEIYECQQHDIVTDEPFEDQYPLFLHPDIPDEEYDQMSRMLDDAHREIFDLIEKFEDKHFGA